MIIGGLQKLTLIDYPDKIACTVFTVGCNFRCPFCHNPELVELAANDKDVHRTMRISELEFFDFLKSRKGLLDGVCVTGGEPLLHSDLPEFLKKIKDLGFLLKLDTNGTKPDELQKLIKSGLVDYVAMDIKTNIKASYEKAAGVKVNLNNIKKSIKIIMASGLDYEFRTTVVPGLHTENDILEIAKEIRGAKKYYLQQFRPGEKLLDNSYQKVKPYSTQILEKILNQIRPFFDVCELRI